MKKDKSNRKIFSTISSFFIFFLLAAFVTTCCIMLFVSALQASIGREFTQNEMTIAAKITMLNVVLISIAMAIIDYLRRKFTVERPVKRITDATTRMIEGDFSVRIPPIARFGTDDSFNEIIACINQMAKELSGTFTIVSGAADGGDSAAILGALESGKAICVLAGGFSALPQGNLSMLEKVMQKGLVISPHPFDTPVRNFSYAYRNKLLAALGEATLVLGAGEKSGALVTAKYTEEFKKPVFALPYAPKSLVGSGCNALIKRGGYLTERAVDVFERLGVEYTERKASVPLTDTERQMLDSLKELGEEHITAISAKSGVPVFKARAVLSALQVKGLVVELGGNRFSIT